MVTSVWPVGGVQATVDLEIIISQTIHRQVLCAYTSQTSQTSPIIACSFFLFSHCYVFILLFLSLFINLMNIYRDFVCFKLSLEVKTRES